MKNMWKCVKCGTLNREETCSACGAHWTTGQMLEQNPEQETYNQQGAYPETPYVYQENGYGAPDDRRTKEQNNNGLIITIVICVTVIVALLLGIGAYIFVQDDDVIYGDETVQTTYVPAEKTEVPEPTAEATVEPKPVPTTVPTPAPTPAPKHNGAAKRQAFLGRADEIEAYAKTAGAEAMTQMDINRVSGEIYSRWDALLNDVYQYLKSVLPAGEFESLRKDELAWIKRKDAAVAKEGEAWGTGSGRPMAENGVATEYTRERCYELINMIP